MIDLGDDKSLLLVRRDSTQALELWMGLLSVLDASALGEVIEKYAGGAAYNIAYVLAYRGETDQAFEWLHKAMEHDDPGLSQIITQPQFMVLHGDPRWEAFLTKLGKSPAQLDAIEFEVTLPQ